MRYRKVLLMGDGKALSMADWRGKPDFVIFNYFPHNTH